MSAATGMFGMMEEIVKSSFILDSYSKTFFAVSKQFIKETISLLALEDDPDIEGYCAKIISGKEYNLDFNVMLIKIPKYDNQRFNKLSYRSMWFNGERLLTLCIPDDLSSAPLDELMLLYFKHFAVIGKAGNTNPLSKTEQSITIAMIYSYLLKMIDRGIGIKACGADTIFSVIPLEILITNGFDTKTLGEEESKLILDHVHDLRLSDEVMMRLMEMLDEPASVAEFLRGRIYAIYAYALLESAEELHKKESAEQEVE